MKLVFSIVLFLPIVGVFGQGSGSALNFNRAYDGTRVTIEHSTDFWVDGELTLEAWVKPNAYTQYAGMIFSKHLTHYSREYDIMIVEDGRVRCTVYDVYDNPYYLYSNKKVSLNTWTHLAFTYSKTTGYMKVYINGIVDETRYIGSVRMMTTIIKPLIGAYWDEYDPTKTRAHFSGLIDEVRVWDRARSQEEIRETMCQLLQGNETRLIGYYPLSNGAGLTVKDMSLYSHDGVLENGPQWQISGAPLGDISTYTYNNSFPEVMLQSIDQTQEVKSSTSLFSDNGMHLYRINELPLSMDGLSDIQAENYFGVFLTDTNADYALTVGTTECMTCSEVFSRNDNSQNNWSKLTKETDGCEEQVFKSESQFNERHRAEYIISYQSVAAEQADFLGPDTVICLGSEVILDPHRNGEYLWSDGSTSNTMTVQNSGKYWVKINEGCLTEIDTVEIIFESHEISFIPNVITPNGDSKNEYFLIDMGDVSYGLSIYNRWGDSVYESLDYKNDWNGGRLPNGVYYYKLFNNCSKASMNGWVEILK